MLNLLLCKLLWQWQSFNCGSHQSTSLVAVSVGISVEVANDESELLSDLALAQAMLRCWTREESDGGTEIREFRANLFQEQVFVSFFNVFTK